MASERQIQLMISVAPIGNRLDYCQRVLDGLRCLANACQVNTLANEEKWMIWPLKNPTSEMRIYTLSGLSLDDWYRYKLDMCSDCACIEVEIAFSAKKKKVISFFARIYDLRPSDETTQELEIRFSIPRSLWNEMDQNYFIKEFRKKCCSLNAIYAAVDQEWLCPTCVSDAPFMYFASSDCIKASYIPAICWAQLLPLSRIKHAETMLAHSTPFCESIPIYNGSQNYIWLQLRDDIWHPSIETRIAFRKFLSPSFPTLDYSKLREHASLQFFQEEICWMPLLDDEKEKLQLDIHSTSQKIIQ